MEIETLAIKLQEVADRSVRNEGRIKKLESESQTLHELVNEGLHNKLSKMPDEARMKLQETLQKIINEGSGGLICIIL